MRVVLGHAAHRSQLVRWSRSVLWHCFQFVVAHLETDRPFNAFVDSELRVVAGILPFLHVDMAAVVLFLQ